MRVLAPNERLIVAADYKPEASLGLRWARRQVLGLAESLKDTGVYLKVNSVLRACGYSLIHDIHETGPKVFADLKLYDIAETLENDGRFLTEFRPELLTTVCTAGISSMRALKAELPDTEVLGVTVLTSLSDEDTLATFSCSTEEAVMRCARLAAGTVDGVISSPKEAAVLRSEFDILLSLNTPGIRPTWSLVAGDDQNPARVMTPAKAIAAGADRIVIGRPITQAKSPRDAVMRTLDEIVAAGG